MPKMKTHKGAKKRMKVTGTGKVTAKRAGKSHLMSGKSGDSRRKLSRKMTARKVDAARYRRAMQA